MMNINIRWTYLSLLIHKIEFALDVCRWKNKQYTGSTQIRVPNTFRSETVNKKVVKNNKSFRVHLF